MQWYLLYCFPRLKKFIKAITEYILDRNDIDTQKIILMGTSFGAAVALYALSKSYKHVKLLCIIFTNEKLVPWDNYRKCVYFS